MAYLNNYVTFSEILGAIKYLTTFINSQVPRYHNYSNIKCHLDINMDFINSIFLYSIP